MLRIEHLSFSFGTRPILADITLQCDRGEIVGIVGRSGIGKSTLLNLAAGILRCRSGQVLVDGADPKLARDRQRIGYLFQTPTLLPWLTSEENVGLPLRLRSDIQETPSVIDAARAALTRAHIADAADRYPHELSGGMQTRVAIARALVYEPALLLMDEPFNALDDLVKEMLYEDFQTVLANSQMASILVTHNLSEAVLLCDRVYILGTKTSEEPCQILHRETIPFDRPRSVNLLNEPDLMAVRKRVREALA